jgi:hypothetical protein
MFRGLFLLSFIFWFNNINFSQTLRCGSNPTPSQIPNQSELEAFTQKWISENEFTLQNRSIITIPVVVHVVWNQTVQNISTEQIQSQIELLNKDFRALNTDLSTVPAEFQNTIADIEIEFCLAKVDPNGEPTNGITRTFTQAPAILGSTSIHYNSEGGSDAWDSSKYLNIWVANSNSIAGIGSFPGEDIPEEDGIEINYQNFGNILVEPPYHLGRTTTHEIGHYLNLCHVWTNDCEDDKVLDTPISSESYLGKCPVHPSVSCGSNDMFMNFMYWTNDACMAMFTKGQKMRMLATLNGPRAGLLTSNGCIEVGTNQFEKELNLTVFPNPSLGILNLNFGNKTDLSLLRFELIHKNGFKTHPNINSSLSTNYFDLSHLPNGIYFLKVSQKDQMFVKKIILAK